MSKVASSKAFRHSENISRQFSISSKGKRIRTAENGNLASGNSFYPKRPGYLQYKGQLSSLLA